MTNNFNFSFEFYKIKSNQDIEYLDNNFVLMDLDYNVIERNKYINTNTRNIAYYITYIHKFLNFVSETEGGDNFNIYRIPAY